MEVQVELLQTKNRGEATQATGVVQFFVPPFEFEIQVDQKGPDRYIGYFNIPQFSYKIQREFRVYQTKINPVAKSASISAFLIQSGAGSLQISAPVDVHGTSELQTAISIYTQKESWNTKIEVYKEQCNVYRPIILKYLPDEFAAKDVSDDLRQFLQVVAFSMDEFYCFIKDFTTIFDPDKCDPKYLKHLAKLINYPLNTRSFDSEVPSIREAAVGRARRQLRQAVEVYKRKGLHEAFKILFYSLGYYIEVVELWTNNYKTFHPEVPKGESLYHPERNPNGWYKSPYFTVNLFSINQQTVCTGPQDGFGQPWSFSDDERQEVLDALHTIRPVHTVLDAIKYTMDLCDNFNEWDTVEFDGHIEAEPVDKMFNCLPDDPQYYREDERLLGERGRWVNGYDPNRYVSRNGLDALVASMMRDPQEGYCDPDLNLEIELGVIEWEDTYGGPITRDCGQLYRDGYNLHPRNGVLTTRDPSCFEGRNGGYWRDTPLAPYEPPSNHPNEPSTYPNGLVYDRSGIHTPITSKFEALYQLAEEYEDGVTMYYNTHEFKRWLDVLSVGMGPDPDLSGQDTGTPPAITHAPMYSDPRQTLEGSVVATDGAFVYSLFGFDSYEVGHPRLTEFTFGGGLPDGATPREAGYVLSSEMFKLGGGAVGYYGNKFHWIFGKYQTVLGPNIPLPPKEDSSGYYTYTPATNTLDRISDTAPALGNVEAYIQRGSKLYVFGGEVTPDKWHVLDMATGIVSGPFAMPVSVTNGSAVAVTEFVYILSGYHLQRFNTITETFETLPFAPVAVSGADKVYGFLRSGKLYFFPTSWENGEYPNTYIEFDLLNQRWAIRDYTRQTGAALGSNLTSLAGRFYGVGGDNLNAIHFIR
jgi:hypothetical protein